MTVCCVVLEPGTWADWSLVIVGLIGGIVAYLTLSALKQQTEQAAKDTVSLNRAYLVIDSWIPSVGYFSETDGSQGANCTVRFRIHNPSRTAARVEEIELKFKGTTETRAIGRMLVAGETTWQNISVQTKAHDVFRVDGVVTYRDIFKKLRHRTFAQLIDAGPEPRTEDVEGVAANDELEWNQE
jgi:hypothetical protein